MFSTLTDPIKTALSVALGLIVGAALTGVIMFFVYEGLRLPLFGQVINGRVANAVGVATSKMVDVADLAVAKALLAKAQGEAKFNADAADSARKQADNAKVELQTAQEKLNAAISEDTGDDGCRVDDNDLQWLRKR